MKLKSSVVVLIVAILFAGCGKGKNIVQGNNGEVGTISTDQTAGTKQGTEKETKSEETRMEQERKKKQETGVELKIKEEPESPANYQRESESGKVKFDCRIETPDSYTEDNVHKYLVSGQCYGDKERILSKYVEGKKISEKHEEAAQNGEIGLFYGVMEDGAIVRISKDGYIFASENGRYYENAGADNFEYQEENRTTKVSFSSEEEAIQAVKQELAETGFSECEFQFSAYPVSYEIMQKREAEIYTSKEEQEQKKESWTQEDDIYVVYGFQTKDSWPIFHQWMTVFRAMAYDNTDNAPIVAIYSRRGIETFMAWPIYNFEDTGETLTLKKFEEIAGTVEAKFENILNESTYEVTRAKLFQMVRLNEKQEYAAEPIWYFEVVEDGISKSVTLVDAVTGREIFLK